MVYVWIIPLLTSQGTALQKPALMNNQTRKTPVKRFCDTDKGILTHS